MANGKVKIPKSGEVYRHYKGNMYIVVGHAHDTESDEILVLYKHYDQRRNHHAFLWARPLDLWNKPATVGNNKTVKRFELLEGYSK